MKRTTLVIALLFATMPAASAASRDGQAGNAHAPESQPVPQSSPAHSRAGDNLFLTLDSRKLNCASHDTSPDGELRNCSLSVGVEVDGPVRYEGNVVVVCDAKFKLRYLRAYHSLANSVSRKVTVHVKSGLGKAVAKIPVRQTGTLHSVAAYKLIKVDVDKLTCNLDSGG